jgi:hypothetical protein
LINLFTAGGMDMHIDGLAQQYLSLEQEMRRVHDGDVLRHAAADLVRRLPEGPLTLITTSEQGVGLVAACACLRTAPTRWERIDLMTFPSFPVGTRLVAIEPIEGTLAWREAIQHRCPDATVMIANMPKEQRLAA